MAFKCNINMTEDLLSFNEYCCSLHPIPQQTYLDMEQQLCPASESHQQAPCLQEEQQNQTSLGPTNDSNSRFEQCDAVNKDKEPL